MGKVSELIELIEKSHPEWKKCTKRDLSSKSGYKQWACLAALQHFNNPDPGPGDKPKKPRNKKTPGNKNNGKVYTTIDEGSIERAILDVLNAGKADTALIRCMIDFQAKIGSKGDKIKDDIDMRVFKELGEAIKNSD